MPAGARMRSQSSRGEVQDGSPREGGKAVWPPQSRLSPCPCPLLLPTQNRGRKRCSTSAVAWGDAPCPAPWHHPHELPPAPDELGGAGEEQDQAGAPSKATASTETKVSQKLTMNAGQGVIATLAGPGDQLPVAFPRVPGVTAPMGGAAPEPRWGMGAGARSSVPG